MEQLIERVKAILLTPQTEWPVIAREPGEVSVLFTRYVAILADGGTVLKDMQGGGQEPLAANAIVHAVLRGHHAL